MSKFLTLLCRAGIPEIFSPCFLGVADTSAAQNLSHGRLLSKGWHSSQRLNWIISRNGWIQSLNLRHPVKNRFSRFISNLPILQCNVDMDICICSCVGSVSSIFGGGRVKYGDRYEERPSSPRRACSSQILYLSNSYLILVIFLHSRNLRCINFILESA